MFKAMATLAGKPAKNDEGTITTTSTTGGFRISPKAALKIGVASGDYVILGIYETDNGPIVAISKSSKDAPGSAKLSYATGKKGTGSLTFSAAAAYSHLGGSSEVLKDFTLEDGVAPTDDEGNAIEGAPLAYVLTFASEHAKQVRKKGQAKAKTTPENDVDVTANAGAMVNVENSDF